MFIIPTTKDLYSKGVGRLIYKIIRLKGPHVTIVEIYTTKMKGTKLKTSGMQKENK